MRMTAFLFAALALGAVPLGATAQPAPATQVAPVRNPNLGDPVAKAPAPSRANRAAATARADRQPPGTQNGNQPDRALAGGGAH